MGGANFWWKVSLIEGQGEEGLFDVGEYSCPLGERPHRPMPFRNIGQRLTYPRLKEELHEVKTGLGTYTASVLSPEMPEITIHYEWLFFA